MEFRQLSRSLTGPDLGLFCYSSARALRQLLSLVALGLLLIQFAQADDGSNLKPGLPEQQLCSPSNGSCSLVLLTCPSQCPQRGTVGAPACLVDCNVSCTATCRNRVPNCFGFGSVCYDPRFIGGDGVAFHFHGQKDQDFCLVSDRNLHVNAHFIGKRPLGRPRDFTWVQALGILFDSHKLSVGAKNVTIWDDSVDHLLFSFDEEECFVSSQEGAIWISPDGKVVIERTAKTNSVRLIVDQLMEALVSAVPVSEQDSRVHKYQITSDNCFAHLNLQFTFFQLSSSVNGVLGETYQPGFKTSVNKRSPMPRLSREELYRSTSLMSADCVATQFQHETPNPAELEIDLGIESTVTLFPDRLSQRTIRCKSSGTNGMMCRR